MTTDAPKLYGIMAEFATPEDATRVARSVRAQGFAHLDAFGPFPSDDLVEAIGFREKKVAPCVLGGGIFGVLFGYGLQYWASVIDYPHNIGGRPYDSWPSFIAITFECAVLFSSLVGVVSLLILNRLPRLEHPVFSSPRFTHASIDHFFVCLLADGPGFSEARAKELLVTFKPISISILYEEDTP